MARVDAGTAVLMIGGGDANGDGILSGEEVDSTESGWGEPDLHFCIVFGLGGETDLIKRGYIFNGSSCPEASMAPKNYAYTWYSLVLPRLKATVRRLNADEPYGPGTKGSFLGYRVSGPSPVPASELTRTRRRTVDLFSPQRPAFFSIINSCGEKFHPSSGEGYWGIDFDANGDIH